MNISRSWVGAALLAIAATAGSVGSPAVAQDKVTIEDPAILAQVEQAEQLGRDMYRYDQAAWHATDALAEAIDMSDPGDLRGYLVEPLGNGNLSTVFFGEDEDGFYEFALYEVAGSDVIGGGIVEGAEKTRLSPMLAAMAAARTAAVEELGRQDWGFCTRNPANTLILPPDEQGVIAVYFLTSTTEQDVYPFGGHYRIEIAADGSVAGAREFTKTCLNMELRPGPNGEQPVGVAVSHLLDSSPTELHFFQSRYAPAKVFVMIEDTVWVIEDGELVETIEDFGK